MKTQGVADWLDRHSGRLFVFPAVLLILSFSIFPLIISAWLALSRFRLAAGGYEINFIGLLNFQKLLTGSQQFHFLGTFVPVPWYGVLLVILVLSGLIWSISRYVESGRITWIGSVGRMIAFLLIAAIAFLFAATIGQRGQIGSLSTTIFYVALGVGIQFTFGTGLAWLCAQKIRGRSFFRVVFFIPLMV